MIDHIIETVLQQLVTSGPHEAQEAAFALLVMYIVYVLIRSMFEDAEPEDIPDCPVFNSLEDRYRVFEDEGQRAD